MAAITELHVEQIRLSTAEAELKVVVRVDPAETGLDLKGKLSGPRCPGVETIQIAYPLLRWNKPTAAEELAGRFVIPEPNLWTAEMPFVYEGHVELWRDGSRIDGRALTIALKAS